MDKKAVFFLLLPVTLLLAISSCTNDKEELSVELAADFLIDSLIVPIDNFASYQFTKFQYMDTDSLESLYVFNSLNESIDQYNLHNGLLESRLGFPNDPKYGQGIYSGFLIHSVDSIFLFQAMTLTNTILMNSKGEVQQIFSPENPTSGDTELALNHVHIPGAPHYLRKGTLHFAIWSLKNTLNAGALSEQSKLNGVFSLNEERIELTELPDYPKIYFTSQYPTYLAAFSRILDSHANWIYSWPCSDSIVYYSFDFTKKISFPAKSALGETFMESDRKFQDPNGSDLLVNKTHYGPIVEDPYRGNFYRIASIGRSKKDNESLSHQSVASNAFSILLLDSTLQLSKEILFPAKMYNYWILFVGKKGLYIPRINPRYQNLQEDSLVFDIYNFDLANSSTH